MPKHTEYAVLRCKKTNHVEVTAFRGYTVQFECKRCKRQTGSHPDLEDTLEHFEVLDSVTAVDYEDALAKVARRRNPG